MSKLSMEIKIDGTSVSLEEIHQIELNRYFESAAFLIDHIEADHTLMNQVSTELSEAKKLVNNPNTGLDKFKNVIADLKMAIGNENMISLMKNDTDYMSHKYNSQKEQTPIKYNLARVEIHAKGLPAKAFAEYFAQQKTAQTKEEIRQIIVGHPDHYVSANTKSDGSGDQELLETMGFFEKPMFYILHTSQDPKDFPAPRLKDYPVFICVPGTDIATGNYCGITAFHQFKPVDDGMMASLNIYFSSKYPKQMVEWHKPHLAIEFSNWIQAAYDHTQNKESI
jgi:hypothetical protein